MKAAGLDDFSSSSPTKRNGIGGAVGGGAGVASTVTTRAGAGGGGGGSHPRAANGSLVADCSILLRVGRARAAGAALVAGAACAGSRPALILPLEASSVRATDRTTPSSD